ncbi:hypothetical protein [Clostridium perfringens]|uniref:N-acetyltransferase domain-containing protein n=1 Tax=Clostridium perfringens E str. JGS1987 TaxID=451755 RepID=B1BVM3_CLOPF|nr:hypothetical protein [Clostridium perfringens]EDT14244.1 conserved hypothetical protein [Clostridium perfringens E str. JGS1987]
MNIELNSKIQSLNRLNSLDQENKLKELTFLKNSNSRTLNNINNNLSCNPPFQIKNFLFFLKSLSDEFFIIQRNNKAEFSLLKKDFSQYIEIALSGNSNILPNKSLDSLNLEVFFLISYRKGERLGINFLEKYISLSKKLDIPIILYCEKKLCAYYERLGFKIIKVNLIGEYLMAYNF